MTKRLLTLVVLVSLVAIFALSLSARVMPPDPRLERINTMFRYPVMSIGSDLQSTPGAPARPARLGGSLAIPNSRGSLVAQTWRDWQGNANQNRWVAVTAPSSSFGAGVQFSYISKASSNAADRNRWGWNAYDGIAGAYVKPGGSVVVQDNSPGSVEAGSYPKIMINPSNGQGIIGSYVFPDHKLLPNFQHHSNKNLLL